MTESIPSASVEVEFGGRKFRFSPLSLLQLQRSKPSRSAGLQGK